MASSDSYARRLRDTRFELRMKTIALLALVVSTILLGACSHHEEPATTTTHTTSTTGYRK